MLIGISTDDSRQSDLACTFKHSWTRGPMELDAFIDRNLPRSIRRLHLCLGAFVRLPVVQNTEGRHMIFAAPPVGCDRAGKGAGGAVVDADEQAGGEHHELDVVLVLFLHRDAALGLNHALDGCRRREGGEPRVNAGGSMPTRSLHPHRKPSRAGPGAAARRTEILESPAPCARGCGCRALGSKPGEG